jgi:cytochrome o ubiquinol oxidase subunit 2
LNVAALTHDGQGHEQVVSVLPGFADTGLRHFVRDWCADRRPLRAAVARDNLTLATRI